MNLQLALNFGADAKHGKPCVFYRLKSHRAESSMIDGWKMGSEIHLENWNCADLEQKTAELGLKSACRRNGLNQSQAGSNMIAARRSGFECH